MRIGLLAFLIALAAHAARPFTPEELLATRRPDDVQVSPDGKWVSFTVRQKSLEQNRDVKDLWIASTTGAGARQLTRDGRSEHARWMPDGRGLVFTSSRAGSPQLYLLRLDGGDAQKLTSAFGGAESGVVSPDGKWVAFTSEVYPACGADDACNEKRQADRDASKVQAHVYDHLFVRHWTEWALGKRTHVFVQPLAGGAARDLTPGDADWPPFSLGRGDDYAFSPDGAELAISHKKPEREAWSTNGDVYVIPVGGGAAKNVTEANKGDDGLPRYSPDGKLLALLSQERDGYESDKWRLRVLDRRSGQLRVVGDLPDAIDSYAWRRDGKGFVVSRIEKGRIYLENVALDGKVTRLGQANADFDVTPDGGAVAVVSGMNRPPEIAKVGGARLTSLNQDQYAGLDLGPAPEEQWVDAKDGVKVHSWLLKPPALNGRAPLLVLIHGGPQGAWEDQWGMRWNPAAFAARGYVVLMVNPRGSFGYGQKFTEQISKDWGGLAYDDILRSVDAAEKLPYVQAGHTCAAGASFGGYMIDWIAGHTDRFACLVSHDGVFDLRSSYGSTEELWFPEFEFGGAYWENPEAYQKWSPSSYVQNFKTPTLVVQGELDFRVATEQGLGMFTALQRRGVESKLLWFPDEGHWVLKPRNSQLWYRTVLDWIDAHAKKSPRAEK